MLQKINNARSRRGQSTLEYAILIVIVMGALVAINFYIKRGLQGRLRQATDDIGDQFSPGNTDATRRVVTSARTSDTFRAGVTESVLTDVENTTTTMNSVIIDATSEFYGR
jgi:hypothetical protein